MGRDNITLVVSAKDLASGVFRRVSASTVAFGVALGNLASKAIAGAINGLRGWINEALESEKANVMLDASLRGVGAYTPQLAQQFRDLADAVHNETGASDESTKAIISQLVAIGVAPDKIAAATRATKALEAIGKGGAQSMTALARALEGDIKGFERLIPGVRMAATEEEKYAALNATLAAGYEQQKANLQTVGGAWEALKGRLGDAREAIIGAVFEGAKIGTTFDDAQAAVGRFLASDSFKNFTDGLKSGAAYVRQIVQAMGTEGGAAEVGKAIGDVILAALKDGADYIGEKITGALKDTKVGRAGETASKALDFLRNKTTTGIGLKAAGAAIGTLAEGGGIAQFGEAFRDSMDKEKRFASQETKTRGGNLEAALARLRKAVESRAADATAAADAAREERKEQIAQQQPVVDMTAALARRAKAEQDAADEANRRLAVEEQITAFSSEIKNAAAEEAAAKKRLATLEKQRADAAGQNINEWIGNVQGERDRRKKNAEDLEKATKRAADLTERKERGTRLSPRDRQWLEDFDRNRALAGGQKRIQNAADAAAELRQKQEEYQKRVEALQKELVAETKKTRELLEENLEVP